MVGKQGLLRFSKKAVEEVLECQRVEDEATDVELFHVERPQPLNGFLPPFSFNTTKYAIAEAEPLINLHLLHVLDRMDNILHFNGRFFSRCCLPGLG